MELKAVNLENEGLLDVGPLKTVIAGPCSAETEEQVMTTATALRKIGISVFRAGIWKPRTRPGCFEGVGAIGLPWLQRVQRELGMKVAIEVANASHVEEALSAGMNMVWIGARTCANPFAVQDIADALKGVDIPVLVKNPISPDLELWMGAMERLSRNGIQRLAAIHRGFSSYEKGLFRYPPQWQIPIELRRRFPELPIYCDASHISGKRELVPSVSQQAMALGFDGLMIECHCCPDEAWSDAAQQLTPAALCELLGSLVLRNGEPAEALFSACRERIDRCDRSLVDLLAERMAISQEMGELKREHGIPVLQFDRYNDILHAIAVNGEEKGLNADFLKKVFEIIHAESIVQQL